MSYNLITILGPTACGKTELAASVARRVNGEIISGDSRQVYRGMDIGTGKDLKDYENEDGTHVPYHLIDIRNAGEKYNLFEFQRDFKRAFNDIRQRRSMPILCGGTGLYIESVLKGYEMHEVPENRELRERLAGKTLKELGEILSRYGEMHNTTDVDTAKRATRAIEIAEFETKHESRRTTANEVDSLTVGIDIDREERRNRITARLKARLDEGLIEEVEGLIREGVDKDTLLYYGLEYKFVTMYLSGELGREEMEEKLEIAIHQFAKRQMTWFRGMEKRGTKILWLDYKDGTEKNTEVVLAGIRNQDSRSVR